MPPFFLMLFAGASAVSDRWAMPLIHAYGRVLPAVARVPPGGFGKQASVAVRPLFLELAIVFAAVVAGPLLRRIRLLAVTLLTFAALTLASDLALTRLSLVGGPGPFGALGNAIVGIDGLVALAAGVFSSANLPSGVVVRRERKRPRTDLLFFGLAVVAGAGTVWAIEDHWHAALARVARIPMLGGLGSVIVIFFGIFPVILYAIDRARRPRPAPQEIASWPAVAVVVPARNEAGLIADCIRAIDRSAAEYPGECAVYVVENGSSDGTYQEAGEAIDECESVRGLLLQCEPRGKAYALNVGLRHAVEEIVLRIDADTLVTASVLIGLVRHFQDPAVGGASGLPLPRSQSSWICRMRALEVYYQVAFKRTGYNAVDAIGVLPGALVAYRRELLLKLNGFAEGVNGEDADMTVRVGRLGYRVVSDPSVRAYTEMPSTLAYLREQRMRWARGTYHMLARNKSGILMMQGLRCVWMLPWAGFVMFRRLMILPFATAGLLLVVLHGSGIPLKEIAAGGAILLGVQLLQMFVCMVVLGEARLVASIPSYLAFRLIVSFFALETLLGLAFQRSSEKDERGAGLDAATTLTDATIDLTDSQPRLVLVGGDSWIPRSPLPVDRPWAAGPPRGAIARLLLRGRSEVEKTSSAPHPNVGRRRAGKGRPLITNPEPEASEQAVPSVW